RHAGAQQRCAGGGPYSSPRSIEVLSVGSCQGGGHRSQSGRKSTRTLRISSERALKFEAGRGRRMKPPVFEYERPDSLRAALDSLTRHGSTAKLLAGGYSLIPMLNLRLIKPSRLIDESPLAGLADHLDR